MAQPAASRQCVGRAQWPCRAARSKWTHRPESIERGELCRILGIAVNYSYVHWDWSRLGFPLESPGYFFLPQISPIPVHLQALLNGKYIDLWLVWVGQQYGLPMLILSASIPFLCLACGLVLLKPLAARAIRSV